MKSLWWVFSTLLLSFAAVQTFTGCTTTAPPGPATMGREGWVKTKIDPGQAITVERGSDTVVIRKGDTPAEYCIVVKPAFLHSPSRISMPLFPGAALLRTTTYGYKEHRFYLIPAGKTFTDVYNWYMSWFEFGDRP